jgi:hypothetical protein
MMQVLALENCCEGNRHPVELKHRGDFAE